MKTTMFTVPTLDAAIEALREEGAIIPAGAKAAMKANASGVILGKFDLKLDCKDGYRITKTPNEIMPLFLKEFPGTTAKDHTYMVLVCTGAKNEKQLLNELMH